MKNISFFVLITLFIVLIGCGNSVYDETLATDDDNTDPEGFYTATANGITLKYKVDGTELHCVLSANTSGWVSVGFNPSNMMKDANFIIGYVENETAFIRDDWGVDVTSHQSDISLGGSENVTLLQGNETEGVTEIEFTIPLNSGDPYDQILQQGNSYPITLARGDADDFDQYHSAVGVTNITLPE
jgi:hypothetical protein